MKYGLVVDDVAASQQWLSEALQTAFPGIELRCAGSIREGLALLQERAPDLALIDLGLPDGSGVALIEWCSEQAPQTHCVVASIFDDDEHIFPALRAGALGYLLKDQPVESIVLALRGIAAGQPPLSAAIARKVLMFFRGAAMAARDQSARAEADLTDEPLTAREHEVLVLIAKGLTMQESANMLGLTRNTVAGYVKTIYRKLNVSSRAEAALTARTMGLV